MPAHESYTALIDHARAAQLLSSTAALLSWDQETLMPTGGAGAPSVAYRGRQLAQLARLIHERWTDPRVPDWLGACEADDELVGDPHSATGANIRELRREHDRQSKLPGDLVEAFSRATTLGKHAWVEARRSSRFEGFRPHLEEIVRLARARAECWGWAAGGEPWDALADHHEPEMSAALVASVLAPLRPRLIAMLDTVRGRRGDAPRPFPAAPIEGQRALCRFVVERMGFDLARGRLDESAHPFCLPLHRDDVRMTTRYRVDAPLDALLSTMHEAGHGIYNQNLPGGDLLDTPSGMPLRFAIHESQARLVENHVGRSRAFWRWCAPHARRLLAPALDAAVDGDLHRAANAVTPGPIRTEADELTYNLHILIRFELERAMIGGGLSPADLPGAWDERYRADLGVEVPDAARGCLQDIHWAMGAIGYFPTYAMGNLYAAQFYSAADAALGGLDTMIAAGDFAPLVAWLGEHIHRHGRRYTPEELCRNATGSPVSPEPFLRHLHARFIEGRA